MWLGSARLTAAMATFTREQIVGGLTRLGQLAQGQGRTVELLLLGGGVMVLVFGTRQSTRDLDVAIALWEDLHGTD